MTKNLVEEKVDEEWEVIDDEEVEKEKNEKAEGEKSEGKKENSGRRYTLGEQIDTNSSLRGTKRHILKESKPELSYYVKLPYPILKKK